MTEKPEKDPKKKRLAQQLRANLARRKGQARARRSGEADTRSEGLGDEARADKAGRDEK